MKTGQVPVEFQLPGADPAVGICETRMHGKCSDPVFYPERANGHRVEEERETGAFLGFGGLKHRFSSLSFVFKSLSYI